MKNPFELFALPVSFEIDLADLSQRYLQCQKSLHPDNFVTASANEQRQAMQQSTAINDAFKTLKDPILRAEALIALHTGEQQDLEQKSTQDVAFLIQQLQWREELEQLEQARDDIALATFAKQIQTEYTQILTTLSQQLSQQQWQQAAQLCDKLRFIRKLSEEIERVEERLFEE